MILQSWHEGGSFAGPLLGIASRTKQTALFAMIGIGLLTLVLGLARRGALTMRFVLGWMAVSATLIGVGPSDERVAINHPCHHRHRFARESHNLAKGAGQLSR